MVTDYSGDMVENLKRADDGAAFCPIGGDSGGGYLQKPSIYQLFSVFSNGVLGRLREKYIFV